METFKASIEKLINDSEEGTSSKEVCELNIENAIWGLFAKTTFISIYGYYDQGFILFISLLTFYY